MSDPREPHDTEPDEPARPSEPSDSAAPEQPEPPPTHATAPLQRPEAVEERRPGAVYEQPAPRYGPPGPEEARRSRVQLAWGLGIVALVTLLIWVAAQARSVSVPLLVAFAAAYVLDPVVDWFERRGVRRTPAILILLAAFLAVGTALVLSLGPQIADEMQQLPDKLRQLLAQAGPWLEQRLGIEVPRTLEELTDSLQGWLGETGTGGVLQSTEGVAKAVYGGTVSALAIVTSAIMVPIFVFYLLRDFDEIVAAAQGLIPEAYRPGVTARVRELDGLMSSFVRGQLLVAGILAVLYSVGLSVVGIPLAVVVGIIAGLGNMIPYVGTAIGLVLATLMALLEWQGFPHLLFVYLVFAVVQALEGWVITPRVVGESVGLSPFLVIIAVLVFGDLLGFFGVLIAVPLAAALKLLLSVGLEHYRKSAFYQP